MFVVFLKMKFLPAGLFVFVCFHFSWSQDINCTYASYGTLCMVQTRPYVTRVVGDQVLVGTINMLQVFSLQQSGLQFDENIQLPTNPVEFDICFRDTFIESVCQNDILTVHPLPNSLNQTLVCGTYSLHPACLLHNRYQLSNYTRISGQSVGYSSYRAVDDIVSIFTSNGYFFSATVFTIYTSVTLQVSTGLLMGNTDFNAGTMRNNDKWLNTPRVVSAYEYGEHVYFFLYERNVENPTQIVSRAVRICMTDDGIPSSIDPTVTVFRTFQKARIECSTGEGMTAFQYNYLMSTSLVQREGATPVLYAVFNPPLNGPPGAAVCKFSFNQKEDGSITSVFTNSRNRVFENPFWVAYEEPVYSCPGSPGTQRDPAISESHILKAASIQPILRPTPLLLNSQFLDKIAAEELRYDGDIQEILYISTRVGDIMQVVFLGQNRRTNFRHTLYSTEGSDSAVLSLILHQVDEERSIVASMEDRVMQILRGQCYCYVDCFSCFDSRDPYCGWDTDAEICINKIINVHVPNLVQTFTAGDSDIFGYCGPRVFPPVVTDPLFPCTPRPIITTTELTTENITMSPTTEASTSEAPTTTTTSDTFTPSIVSVAQVIQESYTLLVSVGTGLFLAVCVSTLALAIFFRHRKCDELKKVSSIDPATSSVDDGRTEQGEYSSANFNEPPDILQLHPPVNTVHADPVSDVHQGDYPVHYDFHRGGKPAAVPKANHPRVQKAGSKSSFQYSEGSGSSISESTPSHASASPSSKSISNHTSETEEHLESSVSSSSESKKSHTASNLFSESDKGIGAKSKKPIRRAWGSSGSNTVHDSLAGKFSKRDQASDKKNGEPQFSDLEEFEEALSHKIDIDENSQQ